MTAAASAATARLFVWPSVSDVRRADALVVLGPGRHGERLTMAERLAQRDVAPVIVVSRSKRPGRWPLEQVLCARPRAVCFRANPFTTRGEAEHVGRLAAARGWRTLLIVTSTYHVTRARLLYDRCVDGRVDVVAADPRLGWGATLLATLHEWGGLVDALLLARSC